MGNATNTTDYTLGKGKMLFQKLGTVGFRDLGNCTQFDVTKEVETLEHFSSREGPKVRDKNVVTQQKASGTIVCDVPDAANFDLLYMGSGLNSRDQVSAALADYTVQVRLDKWVEILDGSGDLIYNLPVAVAVDSVTPDAPFTEGDDYELDREGGLIRFFSDGTGGPVEAEDATVAFIKVQLDGITRVEACTAKTIRGIVYFKGNPDCGKRQDLKGFATLTPADSVSYIGEDFQTLTFTVEFEENTQFNGLFDHTTYDVVAVT